MSKDVSTPKQSGGGGFTFADKVAASFLAKMLAGMLPLDADAGQIQSVRLEKRVDGWFLDDIVLLIRRLDGQTAAIAISVKSNVQITVAGFPTEFVRAVWEQQLHMQTHQFDPSTDYLALATPPLDTDVQNAWNGLLTKAIDADSAEFAVRIGTARYDNEIGRAVFASLNCPKDIHSSKTATDTTDLLKRLRHFHFDFESNPSDDDINSLACCIALLRDGGPIEADSLWTQLKQIARSLATSGGDITRTQLADRLRARFSLDEFPNYVSDWRKLSDDFSIRIERIRGTLAGNLEISPDHSGSSHPVQRLTALVGSSGSGKTVRAKKIAVEAAKNGHAIWLSFFDLNLNNISEQFCTLGIQHSFPELVAQSVGHRGVIVIDGIERLNQAGLANLAVLLRRAKVESACSAWSFVFTCVIDLWDSTYHAMKREYGGGLNVDVTTVAFSFNEHRDTVLEAFPMMARMLQRPNLSSLFGNLKILDLVLSNANEETNATAWVGESDICDWYWTQHIQMGSDRMARSRLAQKLACVEADQFLTAVPIDEFDSDECRLATGLEEDQVISSRDERFGFEHDLLGDWARMRFLISRQHEIVDVLRDKAFNPRWHRAIRLYGLRLLENQSDGNQRWSDLIAELSPEGQHKIESDLVLESLIFAANAEQVLEQVWIRLIENRAALLTRLLTRFLHVATLPDPRYAEFSDDVAIAAMHRIPFWPYWLPLLRVLHQHRTDAIPLATDQVTKIADLWLKNAGEEWPFRNEASQILLDATDLTITNIRREDWRFGGDECNDVFSRFLTAATVRPDGVAAVALSLVERREAPCLAKDEVTLDEELSDESRSIISLLGIRGPLADPWPNGPLRRVNRHVHDGFLAGSVPLQFLFAVRPDVAKEVLLALLIREPLPVTSHQFNSSIDEFLHVGTELDWRPGMYFHGPFLTFLQKDWEKGIETIIELANFVTDRWMDNRDVKPPSVVAFIDGECVTYFGSSDAYFWYRDSAQSPHVVVPALMALERWLYLCIEHKKPIKPVVRQVLRLSRSTALLGVLAAVGKMQPTLFTDDLKELVSIWQLQVWEEEYKNEQLESLQTAPITMMQWVRWGEAIFNMVKEWHSLDHRQTTFGDVLFEQFITNSVFRSNLKTVRINWDNELKLLRTVEERDLLEKIAFRFDQCNWKTRRLENGIALDFVEPEERTKRLAPIRAENERQMALLLFPRTCRTLIDERKEMTAEEFEGFLQQLRRISDGAEHARNHGDAPEHAIMGGIAVLNILHESWIEAHPEWEEWCSEQFVKVLQSPPAHPKFHMAESVSNHYWNNFAAMLMPKMLGEDTTHEEIRSLCAEFALAFNYSVIQDLMNSAFESRDKLGDDLRRLQYLVLVSSGIRNVKAATHGGNSFWDCPDIEFDVWRRFTELIQQFAKAETPIDLPKLIDIAAQSNNTIVNMVHEQHETSSEEPPCEEVKESIAKKIRRGRGFESFHLRAGFSWLERVEAVNDSSARWQWIETVQNLLDGFLRPLGGIEEALFDEEDGNTFFLVPGPWDTWIFQLTASVIPKLEENESGYRLWQPILSFGLDRTHWVDAFISAWFTHGLRVTDCEANFFREWKAMIAYAWARANWRKTIIRSHRPDHELFRHLMGFSSFGHGYFEDRKYRPYVASMKPEFDLWTDTFFPHPEATTAYSNFLTFPSTVDFRRDGVRRIAEASSRFQEWHWGDFYHLEDALLKLLEYDWHENARLISRDQQVRGEFSTILKTMTDRQIPRALELLDKMMRMQ